MVASLPSSTSRRAASGSVSSPHTRFHGLSAFSRAPWCLSRSSCSMPSPTMNKTRGRPRGHACSEGATDRTLREMQIGVPARKPSHSLEGRPAPMGTFASSNGSKASSDADVMMRRFKSVSFCECSSNEPTRPGTSSRTAPRSAPVVRSTSRRALSSSSLSS